MTQEARPSAVLFPNNAVDLEVISYVKSPFLLA